METRQTIQQWWDWQMRLAAVAGRLEAISKQKKQKAGTK